MKVLRTKRRKNSFFSFDRDRVFRDDLVVLGKRSGSQIFLTTFNNIYWTYEIITDPLANGTYKIKVISIDDLSNESGALEGTIAIDFYPLPPKDLAISITGSNVTLTWAHSINGAPDNYVIYGNGGSGNIDKTSPLYTELGSILTKTFAVANGDWKFVVESIKSGVESNSMVIVEGTVPTTDEKPPDPGIPGKGAYAVTGLSLTNVSVGKVKVQFKWTHGDQAASFNVYHDDGTGVISYVTPKFNFARVNGILQTYTTTQLHSSDENIKYKFVVRSLNSNGKESTNTNEYEIDVDGVAPGAPINLELSTLF